MTLAICHLQTKKLRSRKHQSVAQVEVEALAVILTQVVALTQKSKTTP